MMYEATVNLQLDVKVNVFADNMAEAMDLIGEMNLLEFITRRTNSPNYDYQIIELKAEE